MRSSTLVLLLSALLLGCSGEESGERSASTNQTEASTPADDTSQVREPVVTGDSSNPTADSEPVPEIQLERELSFGSTDEVVVGTIETFTVDDSDRVFIVDRDQTTIHVYNPDGSYNTSLGRQGKGPGEFAIISPNTTMKVYSNQLYVADMMDVQNFFPHRINVFSLEDLSFSHTIKLFAENKKEYEELERHSPKRFYPRSDGTFLVSYHRSPNEYQDSLSFIRYVIQDSTGNIISEPIMEQEDDIYLTSKVSYGVVALKFPFYGEHLLAVSDDDHLYSARTEQFKLTVYDPQGEHIRTFQQPFNFRTLTRSELINRYEKKADDPQSVPLKMIHEADNLPETWPALETMFFDDENRLWIATIVDDMDIYEWWLLKKSGEVITKFEWPRNHPIEEVRNDKLYALETEEETGLEEIVRYDIKME